jgi:isoleucyl-tRNA synthetase
MPGERGDSVFLEQWHPLPEIPASDELRQRWQVVAALGEGVKQALEALRRDGVIGSSLDAEVTIYAEGKTFDLLQSFGDELRFIFITSNAHLYLLDDSEQKGVLMEGWSRSIADWEDDAVYLEVTASDDNKCIRCWHHREDVGSNPEHPEICGRCVDNVTGTGEVRQYA